MTITSTYLITLCDDGYRWTAEYPGDKLLPKMVTHGFFRRTAIRRMKRKIRRCDRAVHRRNQTRAEIPIVVELNRV